jgi:preprotein translocase subunit SecG
MAETALTRWWNKGSLGDFGTDVTVSNKTLVKVGLFVVIIFFVVYLSYKNINKAKSA